MKKYSLLIVLMVGLIHLNVSAQYAEPALGGADYSCDPCNIGDLSELTFNWVNSGSTAIPEGSVEVVVSFPNQYYQTDGTALPVGSIANWFDWTHHTATGGDTWVGILNREVSAFNGGDLIFEVRGILMSDAPEHTTIFTQPISNFDKFLNSPDNDNLTPGARIKTELPTELSSFDVVLDACTTKLSWTTASETDIDYFEVEESLDGINFEKIGELDSKGSASTLSAYTFSDNELEGTNYYRLKIVGLDGSIEYSDVVRIESDCGAGVYISEIFPNPIKDGMLNINFSSDQDYKNGRVIVTDLLSREVMNVPVNIAIGNNLFSINPSHLSAASYMLVVEGEGWRTAVSKFIKISH